MADAQVVETVETLTAKLKEAEGKISGLDTQRGKILSHLGVKTPEDILATKYVREDQVQARAADDPELPAPPSVSECLNEDGTLDVAKFDRANQAHAQKTREAMKKMVEQGIVSRETALGRQTESQAISEAVAKLPETMKWVTPAVIQARARELAGGKAAGASHVAAAIAEIDTGARAMAAAMVTGKEAAAAAANADGAGAGSASGTAAAAAATTLPEELTAEKLLAMTEDQRHDALMKSLAAKRQKGT